MGLKVLRQLKTMNLQSIQLIWTLLVILKYQALKLFLFYLLLMDIFTEKIRKPTDQVTMALISSNLSMLDNIYQAVYFKLEVKMQQLLSDIQLKNSNLTSRFMSPPLHGWAKSKTFKFSLYSCVNEFICLKVQIPLAHITCNLCTCIVWFTNKL